MIARALDFLGWYFPAYFPLLLPFLKWTALWLAGVFSYRAWFPDLAMALLTFDLWAITSKFKNQVLRIDGSTPRWEWQLVVSALLVHTTVFLINVGAWLKPEGEQARPIAIFLMFTTGFGPLLILGYPTPAQIARAGSE